MHGDLVKQLHFFRVKRGGQTHDVRVFGQILRQGGGHGLRQRNAVQQGAQVLQSAVIRQAARGHLVGHGQQVGAILLRQRVEQAHEVGLVERAQHALHGIERDFAGRIRDGLVRQGQRIAHGTVGALGQQAQGRLFEGDAFLPQDIVQVADDVAGRHLLEVELQAARQHGHGNLLRVRRGQDELDVLGRLFQRLQHGIERVIRQHVHLIDHIDLEARIAGRVDGLLEQLRHFIDATVRRRIHLYIVDKASRVDRRARFAHAARLGRDAARAVGADAIERFGQDARQGRLADAARAREQVGVMQSAAVQGMRERAHDVLLADERLEILGAVFTGEDLIGHAEILPCDFAGDPARRAQASWPGQANLANAAKQQLYNMASWKYGKHGKPGNAAASQENGAVKAKKLPMAA
ncbi:hypothetical protein JAB2_39240 [Janthinobacterium sp. HH100]|nr:hypothetical protein JAB2_39240 [Janthinobacterium sp. HH100]